VLCDLLPFLSSYPGPRSILVLDNASIHKSASLLRMLQTVGVLVLFLPPYTPSLNPIELFWNQLKYRVKRNPALSIAERIRQAAVRSIGKDQRSCFAACGWEFLYG
jgi:transposase